MRTDDPNPRFWVLQVLKDHFGPGEDNRRWPFDNLNGQVM